MTGVQTCALPIYKQIRDKSAIYGNEKLVYELISHNPGIKRASIQDKIDLEKSQTIEVLNKLRESGLIIKIGNGPATSYKVLD